MITDKSFNLLVISGMWWSESTEIFTSMWLIWLTDSGNTSFPSVLGAVEPIWDCLLKNGTIENIEISDNEDADCAYIKANCVELKAQKDSSEFYSIVAAWKLICDDKDKLKYIQVIHGIGSVSICWHRYYLYILLFK